MLINYLYSTIRSHNLIKPVLDLNLAYWQEREALSEQINLLEED